MEKPRSSPHPKLVALGRLIARKRGERGLSQEALAHRAGLHRTFLGMVERAERNITILNLLRIATALGVKPGELLDPLGDVDAKDEEGR